MSLIFTFTIKVGATLTSKAAGGVKMVHAAIEQTGELRGSGLYFTQDGATWRVSAKDVTGLRRAV